MGASRGELIEWINTTLHLKITKIEETASGMNSIISMKGRCNCLPDYGHASSR